MASRRKKPDSNQPLTNQADNNAALERKLRPIYDCMDFGNYKKALQESDRILKKHPDSNAAKALKALSLVRLGRTDNLSALIKQVHEGKPCDEATLQIMSVCYKELNQLGKICELYESANDQRPDNEELLTSLFMAHVRMGNYKRQQQIGVKLHKLRPENNPYYCWSIMSLIMQAVKTDGSVAQSMLLPLAEKMAHKHPVDATPVELNAEVALMDIILEKQGKFAECVELLRGELAPNLTLDDAAKKIKIASYLERCDKLPEACSLYKELINERPDNWEYYTLYLNSVFRIVDSETNPDKEEYSMNAAWNLFQSQHKANLARDRPDRTPMLAMLEICVQFYTRNHEKCTNYKNLLDYLTQYCQYFASKPCCFSDVARYVRFYVTNESGDVPMLLEKVRAGLGIAVSDDSVSESKEMQKQILYLQLERLCGALDNLPIAELIAKAENLHQRFLSAANNGSAESTDIRLFCDNFLLLSVLLLLDAYEKDGDTQHCIHALTWLCQGHQLSPSNNQIALYQVYIYQLVGAYGPVPLLVTQMDVKHILFDSLGYVYSNQCMANGHLSAAAQAYSSMLRYFTSANRDVCEGIICCYRYGTFTKVEEFVNYKERIYRSLQYALAQTETNILDLIYEIKSYEDLVQTVTYMENVPHTDTIDWDKLSDNRDIPAAQCWQLHDYTPEEQHENYNQEKSWIKLRHLIVRILATAVLLPESCQNSESKLPDLLTRLSSEYRVHIAQCKKLQFPKAPRFTTTPTRLESYLRTTQSEIVSHCSTLTAKIISLSINGKEDGECLSGDLTAISTLLQNESSSIESPQLNVTNIYRACPPYIEQLVNLTETLSFAAIFVGVFWQLYSPVRQAANPRRRKKGLSSAAIVVPKPVASSYSNLKQLITSLKSIVTATNRLVGDLSDTILRLRADKLTLADDQCEAGIYLSYDRSAKELQTVLSNRRLFLDDLTS